MVLTLVGVEPELIVNFVKFAFAASGTVPEAGLSDAKATAATPEEVTTPVEHDAPVVGLNPEVDVQPAGSVVLPLAHDVPVVGLNPEVDVQHAGKFPETKPPVQAAFDLGPNTPSATNPLLACQATTAAFVFGPKLPSEVKPPRPS